MARHIKSLLTRWSARVFSVELGETTSYFGISGNHWEEKVPRLFAQFRKQDRCYSLLVCSSDRVRRAEFYSELRDKLLRDLPPGSDLATMSSFLPDVDDSLINGYFIKGNTENFTMIEKLLRDLEQQEPVLVCSYTGGGPEDGPQWTQHLWSHADSERMEMADKYYVVPSECPPSFNTNNYNVFHSFEDAYNVLKKVCAGSCIHSDLFYN